MSGIRIKLSEQRIAELKRLREEGHPLTACADMIGADVRLIRRTAQELNIAGRMNRGATPAIKLRAEKRL